MPTAAAAAGNHRSVPGRQQSMHADRGSPTAALMRDKTSHVSFGEVPAWQTAGPPKYQPLQSLASSTEIHAEWHKCLLVLQHGPMDDVIEIMKLLCCEMMELQRTQQEAAEAPGQNTQVVWQLLQQQADTLVALLTTQMGQVFTTASAAIAAGPGHLQPMHTRACKYVLNTLMNIFHISKLPTGLRQDTLARMVRTLLLWLVDDNLRKQPEGEALLNALNVLMLKILENSNRNYTFSALLVLLLDTPTELMTGAAAAGSAQQAQMQQARWADLVVKCLIKSTKALPQVIETIDLYSLLLAIHGFFEALGVDEIRRRSQADDKPLRMVKTILHELCKLKGTEIYRYTKDVPQHGSVSGSDGKPVIFPYIDLNIQTLQGSGQIRSSAAAGAPGGYGQAGAAGAGMASSCSVTPGRPGMNRAGGMPPTVTVTGMAADRDALILRMFMLAHVARLNEHVRVRHLAVCKLYSISKELNMPAETLTEQCRPELPPAFKEWLVAELRKHYEHEQRSQQAAAQQQQQQQPLLQVPAAGDTASPWTGQQQQEEEVQPQAQPQQQQPQQVAADAPAAAAAAGGMNGAGGRPPTGMAADRDVVVSRLSVAFTRIASQNAMERHLATQELYAISKELNMPAETLIEQYNPDLTLAFKEWLVAELRKHYEHEQRSQKAAAQQQQSPQLPAAISSDACAMRDGGSWGSLEGDGKASEKGREGKLSKHNKHEQLPHQAVAQPAQPAQEARVGQPGIDSDTAPTRPSADQPQENPQQQQQQQQQPSEQITASTPVADKAGRRAAGSATTTTGVPDVIDIEPQLTQSPGQAGLVARAVNAVGRLIWWGLWGR